LKLKNWEIGKLFLGLSEDMPGIKKVSDMVIFSVGVK